MAEFTYRNVVQRKLEYTEVDDNLRHVEELHDETLAARDVALSDSIIYPDTTAGVAATAEGGYFVVPDTATDELVYYRVVSGSAVEQTRIGARLPFAGGTLTTALVSIRARLCSRAMLHLDNALLPKQILSACREPV